MNLEEWKANKSPSSSLVWLRLPYVSKSVEDFPCKLWIKEKDDKQPRLIYYVIEDKEYLDLFLSNSSDKLRYAVESKPVNL